MVHRSKVAFVFILLSFLTVVIFGYQNCDSSLHTERKEDNTSLDDDDGNPNDDDGNPNDDDGKPKFITVGPVSTGYYFSIDGMYHTRVEVSCPDGYVGISPAFKLSGFKGRPTEQEETGCEWSDRKMVIMAPKEGTNNRTWEFLASCIQSLVYLHCIKN